MKFYTIGVYGSTKYDFFKKLTDNNIDTFCDIRQRRGVRGSKYSFVNSKRLQQKLQDMDIKYAHIIELAPTKEIRELQKEDDKKKGILKRERNELGEVFKIVYKNKVLNNFDFEDFIAKLEEIAASNIVLFCVEEHFLACHRSLVAEKLHKLGYKIEHL
jgi:uncharacterized protein (DUF488 family)